MIEKSTCIQTNPLVSIIIICYNQEHLIGDAIKSCLNQTYSNIEIIVSDDCSTDSTPQVIQNISKSDTRIKSFLAKMNRGITGNCQFAFEQCSGKYIALMGGDDIFYPSKIEKHIELMESDPELAITYCRCNVVNESMDTTLYVSGTKAKDIIHNGYELAANFGVDIPGPSPVVKKSFTPKNGFRAFASTASDWLFFLETAHTKRCQIIPETLAAYRQHAGNIGKKRFLYIKDYIESFKFITREYADDQKFILSAKKGLRRYLLGTFYTASIEGNLSAKENTLKEYKENIGVDVMYFQMKLAKKLPLATFMKILKPIIKRFV